MTTQKQKIEIALTPEQMEVVIRAVGEVPSRLGGELLIQLYGLYQEYQKERTKDNN